jgi:hypothetical protein
MNDFSEIEAELKKLRPAATSAQLRARIVRALAHLEPGTPTAGKTKPVRSRRANWLSLGLGLGLAAAAGFVLLMRVQNEEPEPAQHATPRIAAQTPGPIQQTLRDDARFVPAGFTEVVYRRQDEGLRFPNGPAQPMRRLHYQTRETLRWQNPQTGASLRVSYPSEEVVLLPVAGQ